MKYLNLFLILFLTYTVNGQGIDFFHGSLDEAKTLSQKTGKLIFIDCYTSWCGPCKRMASQVFTLEDVGKYYNENFVNMKIDMEKEEGPSVSRTYGITAYPTLIFIDHKGQLVLRKVGGTDGPGFIELGRQAAAKNDLSPQYGAQFDAGDHSPELVYKYIKALNEAEKSSGKVANLYFKENPKPNGEWDYKIIYEATQTLDSKAFELYEKNQKNIAKYYSTDQIKAKNESLINNSIKRAIEFQSNDIANQVKAFASKNLNQNAAQYYEQLVNFKMADSRREVANINVAAIKLAELTNKENKHDLNEIIYILKAKYATEKVTVPAVIALYEKQSEIADNPKDRMNYALYLFNCGEKAKAIKEAEKAKSRAFELNQDLSEFETVIQYIKSKS